jgi:hypothetical protein
VLLLDESPSISDSSSNDSGEYERTLEQQNDELRMLVKRQSQTIERKKESGCNWGENRTAFVPEYRVPSRALNSCCVACGTKIGSLHAIGLGRDMLFTSWSIARKTSCVESASRFRFRV